MNASLLTRTLLASLSLASLLYTANVDAQVQLADQPVFSSVNVPGNLALALSVEFPTAISVAHPNRTYSSATTYLGYFDPAKCYAYKYTDGTGLDNYFYPVGTASSNTCNGQWSGNYLNWATMQTIDPFRWALTGGYRVRDTTSLTVLEKAWGSNQGSTSNFPDSSINNTVLTGATPYSNAVDIIYTRVWALGNKFRFASNATAGANGASFTAKYYNTIDFSGGAVVTRTEGNVNYSLGAKWFPAGVNTTFVSANWNGTATAPSTGTYLIKARGDDGVRLTIKVPSGTTYSTGNTGWKDQGPTDYVLTIPNVTAGDVLQINLDYYQKNGGAEVSLQWQPPGANAYANVGGGGQPDLYAATATHYNPANALVPGTLYEAFVRVKVCDTPSNLEANCTLYPNGQYKPTGLMQKYSDKIRYSAFGYLNDGNVQRDGGVLRAAQKFIGPTQPVPGGLPISNAAGEWDTSTGVMTINPDKADADATTSATGVSVSNSGVMNYLNKFGQITQNTYKTYDPVGELYYAVQRYFRNLGNVPEYTSMTGASASTKTTWVDGFPVITNWKDPILYACQRNFVLGIGDVNTHADRNLPGATGNSEPSQPSAVSADKAVNALDWTNKVGSLQGLGNSLGTVQGYNGCCTNNGALMAGLAYWANVNDIRPDLDGKQTLQTYWLDVLEFQTFKSNNQFYLATKYGGFTPPAGYSADTATASMFADNAATKSWWSTTSDKTNDGKPRPDNYYTAAKADQMVAGLTAAFSSIATKLKANSSAFTTAVPQVATSGNASYSAQYDTGSWSGELIAKDTSFDVNTGQPLRVEKWKFSTTLGAQASGTGWDTARRIVTFNTSSKIGVPFRAASIASSQLKALDTAYVTGDDSANYLNYLRGDRTNEVSSTATGSTQSYRDRASLLGDIVGAKPRPVAAPAWPYSDANNPGYSAFRTTYANRTSMVYAAANDGMVHAIDGSLTGATAGKEVWAYVPGAVFAGPTNAPSVTGLAALGNPTFNHRYFVDASPWSIDIDFGKTVGGSGTDWRTILVGGLGKGGKAIYALDVTDPSTVTSEATAAQKVLWEFTDPDLGYTYGSPTVVKTAKHGWVVIVGSGYNNADGNGYLFFINPRTGALLEKIVMPCSTCSAASQMGLAHVNAFVLDYTNGVADVVYAGDLLGNIWRLDVTGTGAYPAPVRFASLVGSDGKPLPVTTKVLAVVQPVTNRRYVTVGTGRLLDQSDISNSQPQRFFAILDGVAAKFAQDGTLPGTTSDLADGVTFPIKVSNLRELTDINTKITLNLKTEAGWFLDLGASAAGPGWRVLSDPASFYGTVAFAATTPSSSDVCSPSGTSRVYLIDLGSGTNQLTGTGTDATGKPKTAYEVGGVVVDIAFLSVNANGKGQSRLIIGRNGSGGSGGGPGGPNDCPPDDDACSLKKKEPPAVGVQLLNWREIIVNN